MNTHEIIPGQEKKTKQTRPLSGECQLELTPFWGVDGGCPFRIWIPLVDGVVKHISSANLRTQWRLTLGEKQKPLVFFAISVGCLAV